MTGNQCSLHVCTLVASRTGVAQKAALSKRQPDLITGRLPGKCSLMLPFLSAYICSFQHKLPTSCRLTPSFPSFPTFPPCHPHCSSDSGTHTAFSLRPSHALLLLLADSTGLLRRVCLLHSAYIKPTPVTL